MRYLLDKIHSGSRISSSEALELFSWDIPSLGAAARYRETAVNPGNTAGFVIDRIINFSNVCSAKCGFCAFHSKAGRIDPYELTLDDIFSKIDELNAAGGSQVMLQGGLDPEKKLNFYVDLVSAVRRRYPEIYLHSFSPAEIYYTSSISGVTVKDALAELKAAGLNSMPGASDLLVDSIRQRVSPNKITTGQWRQVMLALRDNGMGSTATMTYGMGETLEDRVAHLDFIRSVQDDTGILRAFIPWSFSPANTALWRQQRATGTDYLKVVAVARIYLDNIKHIQAGWLTEGLKPAQTALAMGADDMGGILMEELVVNATGITTRADIDEFVRLIKDAGRVPVLRDSEYRELKRF